MVVCDDAGAYDNDGNGYQFFVPNEHVGTFCHVYLTFPSLQFRHYSHYTDEGKEAQRARRTCPRSHKCVIELGIKVSSACCQRLFSAVDHRTLAIKGHGV